MIRKVVSILAGGLALMLSCNAQALPIAVSAGDAFTFNFDFSGETPSQPYTDVYAVQTFSDKGSGDVLDILYYSDLNATGSLEFTQANCTATASCGFSMNTGYPDMMDGVFSIVLNVTSGDFTVDDVSATAFVTGAGSVTLTGTLSTSGVPVPATLALLGLGLAGIGYRQRKQIKAA